MTQGIYAIRNTKTGKCYIGASENIERRFKEHIHDLKRGRHNTIFQKEWSDYDESDFYLEILELVEDMNNLYDYENDWLQEYPSNLMLNGQYTNGSQRVNRTRVLITITIDEDLLDKALNRLDENLPGVSQAALVRTLLGLYGDGETRAWTMHESMKFSPESFKRRKTRKTRKTLE